MLFFWVLILLACFSVVIASEFLMIVLVFFIQAIETELLERLKRGIYPEEIYNLNDRMWSKVLGPQGEDVEEEILTEVEEEVLFV